MTALDTATLLHQPLRASARRWPDKTALVCGAHRLNYLQLSNQVDVLIQALRARHVRSGDRVVLFLDNSVEMVIGLYAVLTLGAVAVPVNPLTKAAKLAHLLDDSGATAMLTQASLAAAWHEALGHAPLLQTCLVSPEPAAPGDPRLLPWPEAASANASDAGDANSSALAAIIYTSGTTGAPKGVMLTHHNMLSAARSVNAYLAMTEHDVILSALPMAFSYGLYQVLIGLAVGATVVLERNFSFPAKVLEVMATERATVFPGVPTMFAQ
jgi:acyl-CoA synthetase (AMP-forming)/AMP-acid ligase II